MTELKYMVKMKLSVRHGAKDRTEVTVYDNMDEAVLAVKSMFHREGWQFTGVDEFLLRHRKPLVIDCYKTIKLAFTRRETRRRK